MSRNSHSLLIEQYQSKFDPFEISAGYAEDDEGREVEIYYIDTENYTARSLISNKTSFAEFDDDLKNLYKVTFGHEQNMEMFSQEPIKTSEEFERIVNTNTSYWKSGYKFGAFEVWDNIKEVTIGFESINNYITNGVAVPNTGAINYIFDAKYHNKGVGYKTVGALVLGYGKMLYDNRELVNEYYIMDGEKYYTESATEFKKIQGVVYHQNPASYNLLAKLGFYPLPEALFDGDFLQFEKHYVLDDLEVDLGGCTIT